ncbi:MAG: formylglycine-generating enzyme family protein [Nitrospirae bacterium]|nr:formylglycine-generating enzyme family protein [Nitrospirota bacterium]
MIPRGEKIKLFSGLSSQGSKSSQKNPGLPKPDEKYTDPSSGIEFVFVAGGCYFMGDIFGDGDPDEKPVHEVCVNDFYISRHEVTQDQWKIVMGKNLSAKSGGSYPVEKVSWKDTQDFFAALKKKNSSSTFRLPREAEWEYACRSGGKKEKWSGTANESSIDQYAWTGSNADGKLHPVGRSKPNGIGLYDMSGNVWEWVEDDYAPNCYQDQERDNPICIGAGNRVIRGGSFQLSARFARCSARSSANPSESVYSVGFRVVKER